MKKSIILITVIFFALNLTSCSKDDSDSPLTKSNKELLISKSWVAKSKTVDPIITMNGFEISDIMVLESEEVRKYSFRFNDDGTLFQYDYLNNLIFQTTWSMNSDQTQITFGQSIIYTYPVVGDIGMKTITIQSITSKQITAIIPALYDGVNYVVTITFI